MRRGILAAGLLATLLACWWVDRVEKADDMEPVAGSVTVAKRVLAVASDQGYEGVSHTTVVGLPLQPQVREERDVSAAEPSNLFVAWGASAHDDVEEIDSPPMNPYTFAGRMLEGSTWRVFVTDGEQAYVLQANTQFADGWKVRHLDQHLLVLQHGKDQFEMKLDDGDVF